MTRAELNSILSAKVLSKVSEGLSLKDAINAVFGFGTFGKLAGEIYDSLRSRDAA